ncbi:MAG: aldo/keto reductase [Spirochaetaceae bacterium]|nr:aldo/keto reductase [Spirochaetaceae bacterium]
MNAFAQESLILGCMRLNKLNQEEADKYLSHVIESGITFFDHSDIYAKGDCESIFGNFLKKNPGVRDKITIQDKNAIVSGVMFDCSYEHIVNSVEGQLKRLHTDHLDSLLIHRGDVLLEPEEVNRAFNDLKKAGKVLNFGVSNFGESQLRLLQKGLDEKMKFNQLQFGPARAELVTDAMMCNRLQDNGVNRESNTLDYCRLHNIRIQTWSPLQYGKIEGCFLNHPKFKKLNDTLNQLGEKYNVTAATIVIAFNLRHPANMQVILGTMNASHLDDMIKANSIKLERVEYYSILLSAGYILP